MKQVAPGVHQLTIQRFVNLYFVEAGAPGEWVLIDTGLPGNAEAIIAAADALFYPGTHPQAILLTHGHLDHAGSAQELAEHWHVPIVAHPLELPFLTGQAVYPPADPTVGGSLAFVSRFFPPQTFQFGDEVQALLTAEATPPYLPGWEWRHVPGHAPGQVAFFRPEDGTLLGADAFATTHHDSVPAVLLQLPRLSRCGTPFTFDWEQARASVRELAQLRPRAIGCGHGPVMQGDDLPDKFAEFAANFPMPTHGRYVAAPARTDANGVEYLPPAPEDTLPRRALLLTVGLAAAAAGLVWARRHQSPPTEDVAAPTSNRKAPKKRKKYTARELRNDAHAPHPAYSPATGPINEVHPEATDLTIDPQYLPRNPIEEDLD